MYNNESDWKRQKKTLLCAVALIVACVLLAGCRTSHTYSGALRGDVILALRPPIHNGKQEAIMLGKDHIAARSFVPVTVGTTINHASVAEPLWSELENLRQSWCAQPPPSVSRTPDDAMFEVIFQCHQLSGLENPVYFVSPTALPTPLRALVELIPSTTTPSSPPNPALQSDPRLWRSTRSLAFWQVVSISNVALWRGRLNAKPLGGLSRFNPPRCSFPKGFTIALLVGIRLSVLEGEMDTDQQALTEPLALSFQKRNSAAVCSFTRRRSLPRFRTMLNFCLVLLIGLGLAHLMLPPPPLSRQLLGTWQTQNLVRNGIRTPLTTIEYEFRSDYQTSQITGISGNRAGLWIMRSSAHSNATSLEQSITTTPSITATYAFIDTLAHHIEVRVLDQLASSERLLWGGPGIYDVSITHNILTLSIPDPNDSGWITIECTKQGETPAMQLHSPIVAPFLPSLPMATQHGAPADAAARRQNRSDFERQNHL